MTKLTRSVGLAVAAVGLIAGMATSAGAGVQFNQTIPGFTVGSGIPTGGFETNSDDGALIGLRGLERYVGLLPQTNDGTVATYVAQTGTSGSPPANAARWNLDYYVDFGTSHYTTATLTGTGLNGASLGTLTLVSPYQDSTNLGYIFPVSALYDPNKAGTYTFTLTLSGGSHADLSETIRINAVPEPSTLVSAGIAGLMGLGFAWRRRKVTAVVA